MLSKWKLAGAFGAGVLTVAVGLGTVPAVAGAAARPAPVKAANVQAQLLREARALLSHTKIGTMRSAGFVAGRPTGTVTKLPSQNWSGYADKGAAKSFTSVSASWVEPTGKCSGTTTSLAAFWVGIDGISSADPTVQQDGTIIECVGGSPFYFDWWEVYPGNTVQLKNSVSPGDHISAKVTYTNGTYTMTVTDHTHTADSFTQTSACGSTSGCQNLSAEWIAEAPAGSAGIYPLSNFGTWTSTSSRATYNGKSGTITGVGAPTVYEITMVDTAKAVKALPSSLSSTGATFHVTWKKAS